MSSYLLIYYKIVLLLGLLHAQSAIDLLQQYIQNENNIINNFEPYQWFLFPIKFNLILHLCLQLFYFGKKVYSTKILLMPQKSEMIFGTFSNIAIAIQDISLLLPIQLSLFQLCDSKSCCSFSLCFIFCTYRFCRLVYGFFSILLPIQLLLFQLLQQQQLLLFQALICDSEKK